jgi:hypothetical protein
MSRRTWRVPDAGGTDCDDDACGSSSSPARREATPDQEPEDGLSNPPGAPTSTPPCLSGRRTESRRSSPESRGNTVLKPGAVCRRFVGDGAERKGDGARGGTACV